MENDIDSVGIGKQFTSDELDEKRQNRTAYEYLCRLHEVRNWLSECLAETSIPPPIELEENFRNGVLLARLSHYFAPETVPIEKIFDVEQVKQLQYRHSDNIVAWRRAMIHVRLPEIIIPETVDVYEGRNVRTVFCLYALAIHLFRLRKAPPIRNQTGNVLFSDPEISRIRDRLKDSHNIPSFHEVGGILTDKPPSDDELHKVVIDDVNSAVTLEDADKLIEALTHANAHFHYVEKSLSRQYLVELSDRKLKEQVPLDSIQIQEAINTVNEKEAIFKLNRYLSSDPNLDNLSRILLNIGGEDVIEAALPLYDRILREKYTEKGTDLTLHEIKHAVAGCNACVQVKLSLEHGTMDELFTALCHPALELLDRLNDNHKPLYYSKLTKETGEKSTSSVESGLIVLFEKIKEVVQGISEMSPEQIEVDNAVRSCKQNDKDSFITAIKNLKLDDVDEKNLDFYFKKLSSLDTESQPRNKSEVQELIRISNEQLEKARKIANDVLKLNLAIIHEQENQVRELLKESTWHEQGIVKEPVLYWYYPTLNKELKQKQHSYGKDGENQIDSIKHEFELGEIYVNENSDEISVKRPEKVTEWVLTSEDIKLLLQMENLKFDEHYQQSEDLIRKGQLTVREFLKRKFEIAERRRKEEAARVIQGSFRKYRSRNVLEELHRSSKPSLDCVRKFVEMLRQSDFDYEEEITIEKTKSKITHLINANQKLDGDLHELDKKIGLLIKNRISLQEVVDHSDKMVEERDAFEKRPPSIRKKEKNTLKLYEMLFFHLQMEPQYLANLYECDTPVLELFSNAVFPLFHFASEKREEFLLMRLFSELLQRYIKELETPDAFLADGEKTNQLVTIFSHMFRTFPSHAIVSIALKDDFIAFQKEEPTREHFNLNPAEMYENRHDGKSPKSIDDALNDPEIIKVLESSKSFLAEWSERFAQKIISAITLPRNARYLTKCCAIELNRHFRNLQPSEVNRMVGNFLFKTYMAYPMTESKIIRRETGAPLTEPQKKKLNTITKMIEFAISGKGYGNETYYLESLNDVLMKINHQFINFVGKYISVKEGLDSIYGMNQYTAYIKVSKPILHISVRNVKNIHEYLLKYKAKVVPDINSRIRELIDTARLKEDINTENIVLHLHPLPTTNYEAPHEGNELFVETKKYVVDLLLCGCPGNHITELLEHHTSEREEQAHHFLQANNPDKLPNLLAKKREVWENLKKLEELGLVSAQDHYQDVVTAIAHDINMQDKHRLQRREQLESLQETMNQLEARRKEYNEQLEKYREYLEHCLDNLTITSRKPSIRTQNGGKAEKTLMKRATHVNRKNVKISGEKLLRKDLVVKDEKTNPKEINKLSLEISQVPDKIGVFEIWIRRPKHDTISAFLNFQDLLQAEHEGLPEYVFENDVRFHPTNFRNYLNKKFHMK